MKPKDKGKREALGLLGVFCVFGAGLFFLVRFKESRPTPLLAPPSPGVSEAGSGSGASRSNADNPWALGANSWRQARVALSPGGALLAGICPALDEAGQVRKDGLGNSTSELVVWRVSDRAEVGRASLDADMGSSISWSTDERSIGTGGRWGQAFRLPADALSSSALGKRGPALLKLAPLVPASNTLDVDATWAEMDLDIKVQSMTDGEVRASRLSTGAVVPVRWRSRRDASAGPGPWTLALQPGAPTGALRAAIVQDETDPPLQITPTPAPTSTPVPSPEQRAFLEREARDNDEVEKIVNELQGEPEPSAERARELEERARALNAGMKAERERLFPAQPRPTQPLRPVQPHWARLMLVDLSSGRTLWQQRLRRSYTTPQASWSPDGRTIAVRGTARPRHKVPSMEEERGLEFFEGSSGRKLASTSLEAVFGTFRPEDAMWLPGSILAIKHEDADMKPVLSFFNARNGHRTAQWPLQKLTSSLESISVDRSGSLWAYAAGRQGWITLSATQIKQALAAPGAQGSTPR